MLEDVRHAQDYDVGDGLPYTDGRSIMVANIVSGDDYVTGSSSDDGVRITSW